MYKFTKCLNVASLAVALILPLSACNAKPELVVPNAQEQASLERLHKNCILPASINRRNPGSLTNMPAMRKRKFSFTCDEMKTLCASDYAGEMCKSMMQVASVENAFQKTCRKLKPRTTSKECRKLGQSCNAKGFDSPECSSAISPYNK